MTIAELKKELSEALVSLHRGDVVPAKRVEAWAAALDRAERDHPDPESRHYSATRFRARAAKGDMAGLTVEIVIVLAKLAHWNSLDGGQVSDE